LAPRVELVRIVHGRSPFLRSPVSYFMGTA
jgi:hypothetical protein